MAKALSIRASWLALSLLLALVLVAAAMEEGAASEEGAGAPEVAHRDPPDDDDGAPAPAPAGEETIGAKLKAKGKTVLEGLGLSNIECKLTGNCPAAEAPAPEADA